MRRFLWRKRQGFLLSAIIFLVGAIVVDWYWSVTRLSAAERPLVGQWSRPLTVADLDPAGFRVPDDSLCVLELSEDRTARIGVFDASGAQVGTNTAAARWWVEDGVLVLDYETRPYEALAAKLPGITGVKRQNWEPLPIEERSDNGLRLRDVEGKSHLYTKDRAKRSWTAP